MSPDEDTVMNEADARRLPRTCRPMGQTGVSGPHFMSGWKILSFKDDFVFELEDDFVFAQRHFDSNTSTTF